MVQPDAPGSNLTQAQSLIWTGQQLHPSVPLYNMVMAFRIEGALDAAAFQRAFDDLVAGTDALRTTFEDHDGVPHRLVGDVGTASLDVVDLSAAPDPQAAYITWAHEAAQRPFDLTECLVHSVLLRLSPTEHVWWLALHHLVVDGWSMAILYRRMAELYAARPRRRAGGRHRTSLVRVLCGLRAPVS